MLETECVQIVDEIATPRCTPVIFTASRRQFRMFQSDTSGLIVPDYVAEEAGIGGKINVLTARR